MAKFYTGIGSSNTPKYILLKINRISRKLSKKGYILRSGAANGSDTAFEKMAIQKEIFLPFQKFNYNNSSLFEIDEIYFKIASIYVKDFYNESLIEQNFIARDVQQVINNDIKSEFLICWTRNGATNRSFSRKRTGGTWYAIALADYLNIPIYNLANY